MHFGKHHTASIAASLALILFAGCTSPSPVLQQPIVTHTLVDTHSPVLKKLSHTDKPLKDRSAFYPLSRPDDAFAARLYLIDHARRSLDVQYYIYENDLTGNVFSAHLLQAAQRGVKVRILLDDLSTAGKDHTLALLAYHPNIELRLFNPNRLRRSFRNLALLFDINTLGKRMHNKLLMADGVSAIFGGRNIGDVYFVPRTETLFVDFDMLVTGSIMPSLRGEFDTYWNSTQSISSKALLDYDEKQISTLYNDNIGSLSRVLKAFNKSKTGQFFADAPFNRKIKRDRLELYVADSATLYYDDPRKVTNPEERVEYHMVPKIRKDLTGVDREVLFISPYFIPSEMMMSQIRTLRQRGIKVTVITNSLASTDVFPVYGGYRNFIHDLDALGVIIYELKPDAIAYLDKIPLKKKEKKRFRTSLHTKLIVIDNDQLIVGSANLDPRSEKLNTELVVNITSKKLASTAKTSIEALIQHHVLYRVRWGKLPKDPQNRWHQPYGPVWESTQKGKTIRYYAPPGAGFFKSIGADFISLLPVNGYL